MKIDFVLDAWQEEVLEAEGNLCICSGRQVGKSQTIAIKAALFIARHPKKRVLIVSVTEDQAELMIQKILSFLEDNFSKLVMKGKNRPTRHVIKLSNGSQVMTKAVGQYGTGIRGFTVDVLVGDEAAYMPEGVWSAATPMLLTTGGQIWLLSTPNAMQGYFYEAYTNASMGFKTFHVNSEEVASSRPEPLRTHMLNYLLQEKGRMTALQYAQQYLAQFLEEQNQFFSDALIHSCQTLDRISSLNAFSLESGNFFLGVDIARMGGDEATFEILDKRKDSFYHVENIMRKFILITKTCEQILDLNRKYDFNKIGLDDGGVGAGVFDFLLTVDDVKRKVEALNNARRSLDRDGNRKKKLLKEDMYMNFKRLMEQGRVHLLKDAEVFQSFKSIIVEYTERSGELRIYGRYSHIVEGLIRAAWVAQSAHLNIYFERGR